MAMVELETPVRAYFDAVLAMDPKALEACFTDDAVIVDVDRIVKGPQSIRRWAVDEVFGGNYTIHEVRPRPGGVRILLTFVPPEESSGFRAWYEVRFGERIQSMDLQYA